MNKIVSKPVCLLLALALVFSLAAVVLTFAPPSVASAQGAGMVCQTSLIDYTGYGANTTHNFSVPTGATGGYVLVEFRGDFEGWSYNWDWEEDDFIEVYIDGDYIGRDQGHWDECSENWTAATWALSSAQVSGWAADATVSVMVQNSADVDDFCTEEEDDTYNQHRVTLCYTEPEGPPVGGEAYPVSRISVLAPWIAIAAVLAGGIGWYVLRRRRT